MEQEFKFFVVRRWLLEPNTRFLPWEKLWSKIVFFLNRDIAVYGVPEKIYISKKVSTFFSLLRDIYMFECFCSSKILISDKVISIWSFISQKYSNINFLKFHYLTSFSKVKIYTILQYTKFFFFCTTSYLLQQNLSAMAVYENTEIWKSTRQSPIHMLE